MSRRFRPASLGSQSGIYSVRGSELARSGNTTPNKIRCVVELLDDSEFVIDIDVSRHILSFCICKFDWVSCEYKARRCWICRASHSSFEIALDNLVIPWREGICPLFNRNPCVFKVNLRLFRAELHSRLSLCFENYILNFSHDSLL